MTTLNDYLNDQLKNSEFVKAYEEVRPEIDAIRNSKGYDKEGENESNDDL